MVNNNNNQNLENQNKKPNLMDLMDKMDLPNAINNNNLNQNNPNSNKQNENRINTDFDLDFDDDFKNEPKGDVNPYELDNVNKKEGTFDIPEEIRKFTNVFSIKNELKNISSAFFEAQYGEINGNTP